MWRRALGTRLLPLTLLLALRHTRLCDELSRLRKASGPSGDNPHVSLSTHPPFPFLCFASICAISSHLVLPQFNNACAQRFVQKLINILNIRFNLIKLRVNACLLRNNFTFHSGKTGGGGGDRCSTMEEVVPELDQLPHVAPWLQQMMPMGSPGVQGCGFCPTKPPKFP